MNRLLWILGWAALQCPPAVAGPLFDGRTLEGWEGDTQKTWRVEDGAITGGSMQGNPRNEFLVTRKEYGNFVLSFQYKLQGSEGFVNGGVQFHSQRTQNPPNEMTGYQADIGHGYTGFLYDESRRNRVLAAADPAKVRALEKAGEWNDYKIRAENGRLRIEVNGTETVDYTETDLSIPQKGFIGLQIHGDCKAVISFRNLVIEELPAGENAEVPAPGQGKPLFNGSTLDGWSGEAARLWSIRDGALGFGGDGRPLTHENWLTTAARFSSFDLRFKARVEGSAGTGVFFRADLPPGKRIEGWQVDVGTGLHGGLYREGPRRGMVSYPPKDLLQRIAADGQWNHYRVRAEGRRIRTWVNGHLVTDYHDDSPERRRSGAIALEMSAYGNGAAAFKDLEIEELPEPVEPAVRPAAGPQQRLAERIHPAPDAVFEGGRFSLLKHDTVVFAGPQAMVDEQRRGDLETLLATRWKELEPRFRHMGWEGDTVYRQNRMMEWGSWKENLDAAGAGVVIAWFGQLETFDPSRGPESFQAAYAALLDEFAARTKRIVVIGPPLFEKPASDRVPDNRWRNETVLKHSGIARQLAAERGLVFVDLAGPLSRRPPGQRLTSDGFHFTEEGWREVAAIIAAPLGVAPGTAVDEQVRAAVVEKNELWFNLWRCTNWAFAYGDRDTEPFASGDGKWPLFRDELRNYEPMVQRADGVVRALASSTPLPPPLPAAPPRHDPPAPSPEEQQRGFKVREGFEIGLFAGESLGVVKPIQMRWDEHGRLWVACSPSYPQLQPGEKGHDFILVLEDRDGDGRADHSHRFAGDLCMPMGLEFAPQDQGGGLFVCEGTALFHLPDANRDGVADGKEVVLSGFGTGDTHQDANSLRWGPDGRLWFSQGYHIWSYVETPAGPVELSRSGLWRFDPSSRRLDSFLNESSAGWNCWGIAFDDHGQVFHGSGADHAIWHTTPAIVPTLHPRKLNTALAHTPAKSMSPEFLSGDHLPPDLRGALAKSTYYSGEVSLFRLHDHGATFRSENLGPLVTSEDRHFRPLSAMMGPDGAIYVCDWTNPVIGHYQASYRDPRRDASHGRIWRIAAKGDRGAGKPALTGLTAPQLVGRLASADRWERDAARSALYRLPARQVIEACDQAMPGAGDSLLQELSGVYSAHGEPRAGLVARLARAEDFRRRCWAARLIGLWQGHLPERLDLLSRLVADEHPRVRMEAVAACSWIEGPDATQAVGIATRALDKPMDEAIHHALAQCLHAQVASWRPALANRSHGLPRRGAALVAMLDCGGNASLLPIVRDALQGEGDPAIREKLHVFLLHAGDQEDVTAVASSAISAPKLLDVLAATLPKRRDSIQAGPILARLLEAKETPARLAGCRLAAALGDNAGQGATLKAILADTVADLTLRQDALKALAASDRAAAPALLRSLLKSRDAGLELTAIEVAAPLFPEEVATHCAAILPGLKDPAEVGARIRPFLGIQNGPALLAAAVSATPPPPETARMALQWLSQVGRDDKQLQESFQRAAGIHGNRPAYSAGLVKKLVADTMAKGDAARGKAVFHLPQAACISCHKVDSHGASDLGPDLGQIGRGMSREAIVEAVFWPKRQVKEGYLLTSITTKDQKQWQGYLDHETATEVVLRDMASGKTETIAKSSIQSRGDAGTLMPDGLVDTLGEAQRHDLLRYLFELPE